MYHQGMANSLAQLIVSNYTDNFAGQIERIIELDGQTEVNNNTTDFSLNNLLVKSTFGEHNAIAASCKRRKGQGREII
jgi:hypothetical protein